MKLVTADQTRTLDQQATKAGVPVAKLMENAGLGVAQEVRSLLGTVKGRRIVVLAGPGNNGGDGLVAARHLHDWGADVARLPPGETARRRRQPRRARQARNRHRRRRERPPASPPSTASSPTPS